MFFILSKIFTFFLHPLTWLFILGIWSFLAKKAKRKKILLVIALAQLYLTSNKVLVNELMRGWECEPIKNTQILPNKAVVLGGFAEFDSDRQIVQMTDAAERLFKAMELLNKRAIDTVIISGGAASITGKIRPESVYVRDYLIAQGYPSKRILIDSQSKNTYENAIFTKTILANAKIAKPVLLITSAIHMRRASAVFKNASILHVTLPVHFKSDAGRKYIFWDFILPSTEALESYNAVVKEIVGYAAYWLSGKL